MLDDFQTQQPIVYKMLKNSLKRKEINHAYLFETNYFLKSQNFINAFVKSILCPHNYLNKDKCSNCNQCKVIESGNFPEIKIVNPEGLWIKKEQLKALQSEFNEKALIGNKRIYIINEAEKLGKSAANSILKFLEEPEDGIIAILITENIYNVLETIRSRCQIMRFSETPLELTDMTEIEKIKKIIYSSKENSDEIIKNEEINEKIEKIIYFVNYYEKHKLDTLLYINNLLLNDNKTKDDLIDAFDMMILYYKDIINIKLNIKPHVFIKNREIEKIENLNTVKQLCNKINTLVKTKENIKYNANTNLLIDKLIIDLEGGI